MSILYIQCHLENPADRARSIDLPKVLVDTGSESTWITGDLLESIGVQREKNDMRFQMANGQIITRSLGYAIVRVADAVTVDEVVFAEQGDLNLLGARTLEGLNLMVDPSGKRLVAAGPRLVA